MKASGWKIYCCENRLICAKLVVTLTPNNTLRNIINSGDMYALQQILGHTSLEMVKRYVHTTHHKIVPKFSNYSPLDNLGI